VLDPGNIILYRGPLLIAGIWTYRTVFSASEIWKPESMKTFMWLVAAVLQ
jgi:hypothetical protein